MRLPTTIFTIVFVFASSLVSGVEFDSIDQKFIPTLSFKFRNEPLISICEQIYQATGYEIKVDDKWSDIPITVNIKNDSVISALNKILKSYNHSILIDEKQKAILILFLSDRNSTTNTLYSSSANNVEVSSIDTYAEEYIKSLPIDDSKTIIADSMDTYAQEYIKQIDKKPDFIEYQNIDKYAEEYIKSVSQSQKIPLPIIASDINEYAKEYMMRLNQKR